MKKYFLILLLFYLFIQNSYSQVNLEWAALYNVTSTSNIFPCSMALDSVGNIIATGMDDVLPQGFSIVKYKPTGQLIWARRFVGGMSFGTQLDPRLKHSGMTNKGLLL
ncbi:MAG: hypothetical protein WC358_10975 [Ignavibacteria bacterium]|jgi:hypothetical protein